MTRPARPRPAQPRSLTYGERRARATRADLWPVFAAPPEAPVTPHSPDPDVVADVLDALDQ